MSGIPTGRNVPSRSREARREQRERDGIEMKVKSSVGDKFRQDEYSSMPGSVSVEKHRNVEQNQQQPTTDKKHTLRKRRSSEGSSEKDDSEVKQDSRAWERAGHGQQREKTTVSSASGLPEPGRGMDTPRGHGDHDGENRCSRGQTQGGDGDDENYGQEFKVLVKCCGEDGESKSFHVFPTDEEKPLWMFVCYCPKLRKGLEEELASAAVEVNCSEMLLEICILQTFPNEKELGDIFKRVINRHCERIKRTSYTVSPEAMEGLIAEIHLLKSGRTKAKRAAHFASKMANLYFNKTNKTCLLLAVAEVMKEAENAVDKMLDEFPDSYDKHASCTSMLPTLSISKKKIKGTLPVTNSEILRLFDQFPCYVYEGVSASCDFDNKHIVIQGDEKPVKLAWMNIKESVENVQLKTIAIPAYHESFFQQPTVQQYINGALGDEGLRAHWVVRSGSIGIFTWPSEKIDFVEFTIKGCYYTEEISDISKFQSNLWSKIKQKLKEQFGERLSVFADITGDYLAAVSFVCTADIDEQCCQAVRDAVMVPIQQMGRPVITRNEWKYKFLEKYPAVLKDIENRTGTQIIPEMKGNEYSFRIGGMGPEALDKARDALKETLKHLQKDQVDIDEKFKKDLDTADGRTWIKRLETESSVMVAVEESCGGKQDPVQMMVDGTECTVVVTRDDHVQQAVLVKPCYGKESVCMDDIGRKGQTTASIYWPQNIKWDSNLKEKISKDLIYLFNLCDKRQESAVFFPLHKFSKVHNTLDDLVSLIVLQYTEHCQKIRKHDGALMELILYTDDSVYCTKLVNSLDGLMSGKSVISVFVKQGSLAEQRVDAVVNSVNGHTLNLSHGAVSSSLLKVAGSQMQKEANTRYPKGIQPGEIAVTNGCNLQCKYVFHSSLMAWNTQISGSDLKSAKMLHSIVQKCLAEMDALHLHTIAFPALGTGQLLYPCNVVAEQMFRAVEDYRRHNPSTGVKEVTFVVYQTGEMHTRFMKEKVKWEKRSVPSGASEKISYQVTIVGSEENVHRVKADLQQRKVSGVRVHVDKGIGRQLSAPATSQSAMREGMGAIPKTSMRPVRDGGNQRGTDPRYQQPADGGTRRDASPRSQQPASTYSVVGGSGDVFGIVEVQSMKSRGSGSPARKTTGPGAKRPHTGQNGSKKTLKDFLVNPRVELSKKARRLAKGKELHIQKELETNYKDVKVEISDDKVITLHADLPTIEKLHTTLKAMIESTGENTSDYSGGSDTESNGDDDSGDETTPAEDTRKLNETLQTYNQSVDTSVSICDVRGEVYESMLHFYKVDIEDFLKNGVTCKHLDDKLIIFSNDKKKLHAAQKSIQKIIEDIEDFCFTEFMLKKFNADQILQFANQLKAERHWKDVFLYKADQNVVILVGSDFEYVHSFEGLLKVRCAGKDVHSRQGRNLAVDDTPDNPPKVPPRTYTESSTWQEHSDRVKKRQNIPVRRPPSIEIPADARKFITREGVEVYVYNKDLLSVDADCIVNAANSSLRHGGGIAKAIAKAAGPQLEMESREYINQHGSLPVGHCCITTAGWMKYQCVIHTVGPRQRAYNKHNTDQLQDDLCNAVQRSFIKAKEQGYYSIGVPSISSGIFAVPKGCCALQYGRAVKEYSQRYGKHGSLQEIHFVDIDDEMLQFISVAFDFVINGNARAEQKLAELEQNKTKKWYQRLKKFPQKKPVQPFDKEALHFTVSGVDILPKTGNLVEFGEGVIVCSQEPPFDRVGGVAAAIEQLHPNFLNELKNKFSKVGKTQPGDIVTASSGHNLRSAHIYNVVVPHHGHMDGDTFSRLLHTCYYNALKKADDSGIRKIAFPLLATGRRGASADMSARCLMNALTQLGRTRSLKQVHVINKRANVTVTVWRVFSETLDGSQVPGQMPEDRRRGRSPVTSTPANSSETEKAASMIRDIKNFKRNNSEEDRLEEDDNVYTTIGLVERSQRGKKFDSSEKLCPICLETIEGGRTLDKCGHVFHGECIDECFKRKPVCPTCGAVYGELTGNQPLDGTMDDYIEDDPLEGYRKYRTIVIKYRFPRGIQSEDHPSPGERYVGTRRTAYLPDSSEGRIVLELLKVAFKRRLIFTVGRSVTSGEENIVTWNDIHHKTKRMGGAQQYGYPDPEYLGRVQEELAIKGVTKESLKS